MPVEVSALVALIYEISSSVINRCKVAKQCPREAGRIGLRTLNILGLLGPSVRESAGGFALETKLLELRRALDGIAQLVELCKQPVRFSATTTLRVCRMRATREALRGAEVDLQQITADLRLPLLAEIELQLDKIANEPAAGTMRSTADKKHYPSSPVLPESSAEEGRSAQDKARDAIEQGMKARTNESTGGASVEEVILDELRALTPPPPAFSPLSQEAGGSVLGNVYGIKPTSRRRGRNVGNLLELKRVRFEGLVEERHLGHGTFGKVLAGKYFGKDVAIKKARATVTAVQTLEEFRYVHVYELIVCAMYDSWFRKSTNCVIGQEVNYGTM